jgi:hypothetical protein
VGCIDGLSIDGLSVVALRSRRTVAFAPDSEFSLNFSDAAAQAVLDLCNGLGFSEVTGLIEMLQVGAQFV